MRDFVTITEAAIKQLKLIADEECKPYRIRMAMTGGGCAGYTVNMDFTKFPADEEFDLVFEHDGITFIVDDKSAVFLMDATLDYGGGLLDRGFKWTFPKATGGCGCGVSFSF